MKRPKPLTIKQKQLNDIKKCGCCKRVMLEKYFDYFPHNNPDKVYICIFCFTKKVEKHRAWRPGTDPLKDKKHCDRCAEDKLLCLFSFRNKSDTALGGFAGWCQACKSKKNSNWFKSLPEKKRKKITQSNRKGVLATYYRHRGTPRMRDRILKQNARSAGVPIKGIDRHTIAKDLQAGQRCGLSGEKLPLSRPTASFRDRGKTRAKIRGGEYSPSNTIYAIPGFNYFREIFDLNMEETRDLLKEMKKDNITLYRDLKNCIDFRHVAALCPEIIEWFGDISLKP